MGSANVHGERPNATIGDGMATDHGDRRAYHRLYGLTLATTVPVGPLATTNRAADEAVDWTIGWVDPPADPRAAPPGRPIVTEGVWPAVRDGDVVTLWHEDLGRVGIDLASRRIALGLTVRTDEVAALLLRGIVLALALELTGVPTLHANGVVIDGGAVAVAGPRGVGKTTVTAALCAAGLELLSDDLVAIDAEGDRWCARAGLTQLRLRGEAAHLAELIGDRYPQASSVDGRHVVVLPPATNERSPLRAIVVPRVDDTVVRPQLVRLTGAEAFRHVAVGFRIATFVDPPALVSRLAVMAALARSVPVLALTMPLRHRWTADDAIDLRHVFDDTFSTSSGDGFDVAADVAVDVAVDVVGDAAADGPRR